MAFHSGKISFMPLSVKCKDGVGTPSATAIEAEIVMRPYKPLEEKERSRISFVNMGSKIPEEFEKVFENSCQRSHVVCEMLYESRVIDMAIVNARTKEAFENAKRVAKHISRPGYGGDEGPSRDEIRERIIDEELEKCPIARKTTPIAFCPEQDLILFGSKSESTIDMIVPTIKRDLFGLTEENIGDIEIKPAMSTVFYDQTKSIKPFGFIPGQYQVPKVPKIWNLEFLTWMFVNALPDEEGAFTIGEKIKVDFCKESEAKTATFVSKEANDLVRNFGSQWASKGGLISEIMFWVPYDGLNLGLPGYSVKIDKSGYFSNISVGKMKHADRMKLLDTIIDGCCEVTKDFVKKSRKLAKLRSDLGTWITECQRMKEIVVDIYPEARVNDNLEELGIR